jgi:hypothetical protein
MCFERALFAGNGVWSSTSTAGSPLNARLGGVDEEPNFLRTQ